MNLAPVLFALSAMASFACCCFGDLIPRFVRDVVLFWMAMAGLFVVGVLPI